MAPSLKACRSRRLWAHVERERETYLIHFHLQITAKYIKAPRTEINSNKLDTLQIITQLQIINLIEQM